MEKKLSLNDEIFLKSISPHSLDPKIIENNISLSNLHYAQIIPLLQSHVNK